MAVPALDCLRGTSLPILLVISILAIVIIHLAVLLIGLKAVLINLLLKGYRLVGGVNRGRGRLV